MNTTLTTRESGQARFMRMLDAYMKARRNEPIDGFDADSDDPSDSGFALKIGGEIYAFTLGESDAFLEVLERIAADEPEAAKAVDLPSLIRITKAMAERTRARIGGQKA